MIMARQPLEENGVHRARLWEVGFYALNNSATNAYMMMVSAMSYYLIGIIGLGAVLAGSLVTIMRIWDGVANPFVGMILDKTNGRFGKNRPFIVIGEVILFAASFLMFRVVPLTPPAFRLVVWIVIYMIYVVGYTCQCIVTKSAQSCLTNDPKQRPIFSMFDAVYNIILMSLWYPIFQTNTLVPRFTLTSDTAGDKIAQLVAQTPNLANVITTDAETGVQTLSAFYNPEMWQYFQLVVGGIAAVLSLLAVIGLWRKDRPQYFGLGQTGSAKVGMRDYLDVLTHNRPIQMLAVSTAADKLTLSMMSNTTVYICLFGVIFGNYALYSSNSAITAIPVAILSILGINFIARYLGQKRALVVGTCGSIACGVILAAMILAGVRSGWRFLLPSFSLTSISTWAGLFRPANWSLFGLMFVLVYTAMRGFTSIASAITTPMTADCADYEVYRSGKYLPGVIGTVLSFVDKLISSLASTVVAAVYAAVGFGAALPTVETPYSASLMWATLICFIGAPMLGWITSLIVMRFYPLTKEKMEEIQEEIARIKAGAPAAK